MSVENNNSTEIKAEVLLNKGRFLSVEGAAGVAGSQVDFEESLPRPISEIKNDISTPREKDESDNLHRDENRDS